MYHIMALHLLHAIPVTRQVTRKHQVSRVVKHASICYLRLTLPYQISCVSFPKDESVMTKLPQVRRLKVFSAPSY